MSLRIRAIPLVAALLLIAGGWQLAAAGWIHVKARIAQELIALAWDKSRARGEPARPWPWADMHPVARLSLPARGIDVFVFGEASGRALAFGPGHVSGTAPPGAWGNTVVVAHRDTHFAFLRDLAPDDEIELENAKGLLARYRVEEIAIVDKHESRLLDEAESARLTLITCYPFDAVRPGTPLRYVVVAARVA